MQFFEQQDDAYQQWVEHHAHGYVLNCPQSRPARLHTPRCSHLYPFTTPFSPTKTPKLCSESLHDLLASAAQRGLTPIECTTCKPYAQDA